MFSAPPCIHTITGLRVAGYDDPYERRSAESFKDRYNAAPDPAEQERREQLEQRAEDAERERQQTEDYTDDGAPYDPGTPQW